MRQRNDTGYAHEVMVWPTEEDPTRRPFTVAPDEVVDRPYLISSFTLVEPAEEGGPARKRKDAAVAAEKEEGEPQ